MYICLPKFNIYYVLFNSPQYLYMIIFDLSFPPSHCFFVGPLLDLETLINSFHIFKWYSVISFFSWFMKTNSFCYKQLQLDDDDDEFVILLFF